MANPNWYGACHHAAWKIDLHDPFREVYGYYCLEKHFDMMKEAGANTVRFYMSGWAWLNNALAGPNEVTYKQFIDQVADWCYARGLKVVWSFHVFTRWGGGWSFDNKRIFLLTGSLDLPVEGWTATWDDYMRWLRETMSSPKVQRVTAAVQIFNEPPFADDWESVGPNQQLLEDRWIEFAQRAIDTVRTVMPTATIMLDSCPFWSMNLWTRKSIDRPNIVYHNAHYCYLEGDLYAHDWTEYKIAQAFYEGRDADGISLMRSWFTDLGVYGRGLFGLQDLGYPVVFGEVGTDPSGQMATFWSRYMQAFYNLLKERGIGFIQHYFQLYTPGDFGMLADLNTLNEIGQLWARNMPTPISPLFPRVREFLWSFPVFQNVYARIDTVRAKREQETIMLGRG